MTLRTFKVSFTCENSNLIAVEAPDAKSAIIAARKAFEDEQYNACTELGYAFLDIKAQACAATPYHVTFVHQQYQVTTVIANSAEAAEAMAKRLLEEGFLEPERTTYDCTDKWLATTVTGGQL
jgi:hypothetical protein